MVKGQLENRNFLSPTGFKFTITRAPKVSFFCNKANIPDLTLGVAVQPSYLKNLDTPGDKIEYGDLNLQFLIDENLENYMEIHNWITGLGYPEYLLQFRELEQTATINEKKYTQRPPQIYSDGELQVLNSAMVPKIRVSFKDLFPYSLSTVPFDATNTDIQYFTADVSFKYTIYNLLDLSGNKL